MQFPSEAVVSSVFDDVEFPRFVRLSYEPDSPALDDVRAATLEAVAALDLDLPPGATVAVGVGSRGIHDLAPIVRTTVEALRTAALEPVVVPAMGSHGGATAAGQREVLASLGVTEETLDCPIDARMETETIGTASVGDGTFTIHFSTAALEADAVLPINRIKPHTNFTGRLESGIAKMLVVGFGKQPGAKRFHEHGIAQGYEPVLDAALAVIRDRVALAGAIGVLENFYDRTMAVEPLQTDELEAREAALLAAARDRMATLPYDELDVLIVDEIGKDVSGAGMDTNVIGRYRVLNAADPPLPDVKRIYVRNLTPASHGNGIGIGLADITRQSVVDDLDLEAMYTNALTSGSLSKAALPVVLPNDELALTAAVSSIGTYDRETVRMAWVRNTGSLSELRVSSALLDEPDPALTVRGHERLTFDRGTLSFEPLEPPS